MAEAVQNIELNDRLVALYQKNREILESNSSDLLNKQREAALESFKLKGIPTTRNENYKYTDLTEAFSLQYRWVPEYEKQEVDLHDIFKCEVPELDTHLILLVNGWFYARNREVGVLPEGVIVCSMKEAMENHADLIAEHYNSIANNEDPIVALNTAFAADGFFIYIPKNLIVEKPIQVVNLMSGRENTAGVQRNLVIAERSSEVKLTLCDHTLTPAAFLLNNTTELFAKQNAKVDVSVVQNQHNMATNLNSMFVKQEQDSHVINHTVSLHGGLVRNNLTVNMDGSNAETEAYGFAFVDQDQHVDNFTTLNHNVANCLSNQIYKTVVDDKANGAFTGCIHVKPNAAKTKAFQRSNNILLTKEGKMNAKPQLIIDNDDVKCSHGATVGQIDQDALFYLRSRGISEREAHMMMMFAFAHEVLEKISIEPLRNRIDELIDRRFRGESSHCESCMLDCNN